MTALANKNSPEYVPSERGQRRGQEGEVLDRAAAWGRGRVADTRADGGDKAPQSISCRSAVPGKKEVASK